MPRNHVDWLTSYVEYASFTEAPKRMHFFCGACAISGALRRKVWLDMKHFQWYPNMYIILVAPPGVVAKSTTAGIAMRLLRKVPGINFGPEIITWPALATAFAGANESYEYPTGSGEYYAQSALTLESSEFGNLVNPSDTQLIDFYVSLWDGKTTAKVTKGAGSDMIENPYINMVGCTTPAWIAGNFPEYVIGGGFMSRCLLVYAEKKDKLVAYPHLHAPKDLIQQGHRLIQDLEHIATNLCGPYELTAEAIKWGETWYQHHHDHPPAALSDERLATYLARKQTHLHKLAMIMAASVRDELYITADDLALALTMIKSLEEDMPKVFAKIGRTEQSIQAERFISYITSHPVGVPYANAYQFIHAHFPMMRDFEGVVKGAVAAGLLNIVQTSTGVVLKGVPKPIIKSDE